MDRESVYAATAQTRRTIADLVGDLDEAQLQTPSLCEGWNVKTVAAHLVCNLTGGIPAGFWHGVRHGILEPNRALDHFARDRAQLPATQIAAHLRHLADSRYWCPPPRGYLGPLADVVVHDGDIRIPLGLAFEPEPWVAAAALDRFTSPWYTGLAPTRRFRGIGLSATDIDRDWCSGEEVHGPVAALLMTAAGRTALVDQLEGPGLTACLQQLSG